MPYSESTEQYAFRIHLVTGEVVDVYASSFGQLNVRLNLDSVFTPLMTLKPVWINRNYVVKITYLYKES